MVPSLSGRCSQTKWDLGYAGAKIASARCARRMAFSICSVNGTRSIHADRIYPFTAGEGVGVHGSAAGQRLPNDDDSAGVAVGNRIASAHGVEEVVNPPISCHGTTCPSLRRKPSSMTEKVMALIHLERATSRGRARRFGVRA